MLSLHRNDINGVCQAHLIQYRSNFVFVRMTFRIVFWVIKITQDIYISLFSLIYDYILKKLVFLLFFFREIAES